MRTILLGPNGQLGSDIRSANAEMGEFLELIPVSRSMIDLQDVDAASSFLDGLEFDCLVNCSSYHKTDEVEKNATLAFTINAHLPQRLAEICLKKKARFVHFSTDYVFGGGRKRDPFTEDDCKAPLNVYGASKAMGEDLVIMAGANTLILRVASMFGVAGASGKGGNFVETMIRLGREKGQMRVVDDQVMSPTATADVARWLLEILRRETAPGIWNLVNSGAATWYQFAARIVRQADVSADVIPIASRDYPTAAKRPSYSVLDNSKLGSVIGPVRSWQDALDDYLVAKQYRTR
jgi:dTDP-4-dehydrorhamnose reductase